MTDEQYDGIIETIQNQNIKCENYNYNISNYPIMIEGKYLTRNGGYESSRWYNITEYIPINANNTYTFTNSITSSYASYCLYDNNKNIVNCMTYNGNTNINVNYNGYVRFSINTNTVDLTQNFTGQYCYNLIEKQNEKIDSIIGGIIFIIGILFVISLLTRRLKY